MMISKSYRSSLLRNSSLIRHFSTKEVLHSLSAKKEILKGVNLLVNTIQSTLGPRGRNIVIDIFYSEPKITKDGLSVAKSIDFSNKYHNIGANLIKQVANRVGNEAGDGTTTATILAREMFKEGIKCITTGMNPMEIRKGMFMYDWVTLLYSRN